MYTYVYIYIYIYIYTYTHVHIYISLSLSIPSPFNVGIKKHDSDYVNRVLFKKVGQPLHNTQRTTNQINP